MTPKNVSKYHKAKRIITIDEEANTVVRYDALQPFYAYIYPASGQVQAQQYGRDLNYILNMITTDDTLDELDGVQVFSNESIDYEVISKKRYKEHMEYEIQYKSG